MEAMRFLRFVLGFDTAGTLKLVKSAMLKGTAVERLIEAGPRKQA